MPQQKQGNFNVLPNYIGINEISWPVLMSNAVDYQALPTQASDLLHYVRLMPRFSDATCMVVVR